MGEWAGSVRAGAHSGAARAMRGVGQGARVEEAGSPAGAHRVGGPALCGLRACRAPPSLTRACAFFLGRQGQRAPDDRPHAHGRAAAAARESAASSRLRCVEAVACAYQAGRQGPWREGARRRRARRQGPWREGARRRARRRRARRRARRSRGRRGTGQRSRGRWPVIELELTGTRRYGIWIWCVLFV